MSSPKGESIIKNDSEETLNGPHDFYLLSQILRIEM